VCERADASCTSESEPRYFATVARRRVLLVVWDGGGNLPPMLALAGRLVGAGHDVTVLGPGFIADRVAVTGARLAPFRHTVQPEVSAPEFDTPEALSRLLAGPDAGRDTAAVVADLGPDVAIVDCMLVGALTALEAVGVPTVPFLHMRYAFFTDESGEGVGAWLGPLVAERRHELGLAPITGDKDLARRLWEGRAGLVSMVPPLLETPLSFTPVGLTSVGPVYTAPTRRASAASGPPLVVVNFSTTLMQQTDAMRHVVRALGALPVRGLCSTGGLDLGDLAAPDNVEVVRWFDPAEVLPRASAVVTHAGMGSTLAALSHGVPLVCLPLGRDQGGNAARVQELGAGVALEPTADPATIGDVVDRVLSDARYREVAGTVADECAALGWGERAVAVVEAA
jgi:UDP:flavonoid glycosyltransferase YjiC (YdhE family)